MSSVALVVDLDGTLVNTDMLHELAVKLFSEKPLAAFGFPLALRKGKAYLKQHICSQTTFDAALLPYNKGLLAWLKEEHAAGRKIVLCTASDQDIAQAIADHLGLFSEVMASDGRLNLSGENKANALIERYGDRGFDYCGNASIDLLVWKHSRNVIAVNASDDLLQKASMCAPIAQRFSSPRKASGIFAAMLKNYGLVRNLVILAPALLLSLAGQGSSQIWLASIAIYSALLAVPIGRDILRITPHREHPPKSINRFASGEVPIIYGVATMVILLTLLIACAAIIVAG